MDTCKSTEDYNMETYDSLMSAVISELEEMKSDVSMLKRERGENGMGGYTNTYMNNMNTGLASLQDKVRSLNEYVEKHSE